MKRQVWAFVAAVVLLPLGLYALVNMAEHRFSPLPVLGPPGHVVADYRLQDQQGRTVTGAGLRGGITVANFFFTHCPVVCPKMTYNLKRVQAYAGVGNLAICSFTVDPERDSVAQLRAFARKHGIRGNWQLLTGSKQVLYRLARKSLMVVATDGDGGPDDFIHSENLVLIDPQGRIRGYYDGTKEAAVNDLVRDLRKLAGEGGATD